MRIAMISYHTCPLATLGGKDTGGMNVYVRDLTRYLGRLGVQVDVYTRSQDEHAPHISHDLGYGNRVIHVNAGPPIPLGKEELSAHIPAFVNGILDFAKEKDFTYDIIHSHYWMSGLAAKELKKVWDLPVIHMFHTLGVMKQRIAQNELQRDGEFRVVGEYDVIKMSDQVVAATPAELAQLQWLYDVDKHKITVIPPGVDRSRFYPIPADEAKEFIGVPISDKMILFVGRIEPLKGIDALIHAIGLMKERGIIEKHRVCLSIIGGEPGLDNEQMSSEMTRLQTLKEKYDLGDMVAFLGKKNQDTLPYYYSSAEVVIMPSHYESFGMVALESMSCGTPVIASEVGGLAYLVQDGETGFHIPVDDPESLSEHIIKVLEDPQLRDQMSKSAVATAAEYDWMTISTNIKEFYENNL